MTTHAIAALTTLRKLVADDAIITDTINTKQQRKTLVWNETALTAKPFVMRVTVDTLQDSYAVKIIDDNGNYVLTQGQRRVSSANQLIHSVGILRDKAVQLLTALDGTRKSVCGINNYSLADLIPERTAKLGGFPISMTDKPKLKFKRLHANAVIPKYETAGAAGLDLTAVHVSNLSRPMIEYFHKVYGGIDLITNELRYMRVYRLGLAVEIPKGFVGLLIPRSSVATKMDLSLANSVGVIDSDYRGELMAVFRPHTYNMVEHFDQHGTEAFASYGVGERVCQLVVVPAPQFECVEVDELGTTDRGEGGFGSTGK